MIRLVLGILILGLVILLAIEVYRSIKSTKSIYSAKQRLSELKTEEESVRIQGKVVDEEQKIAVLKKQLDEKRGNTLDN